MSPTSHHSYQIAILAASQLVCDTLAASLRRHQPLPVRACATTVAALLPHFMFPTILLLDATPGVETTLPLIRHLLTYQLPPRILVLGIPNQPEPIMRYIEAGVRGYLLQNESLDMLLAKVHAVTHYRAIISPTIAAMMIDRYHHYHQFAVRWHGCVTRLATLTHREREVFALIGQGLTNNQIADALVVEYGTVKNYVHHILAKVACSTRAEVVALYRESLQPFPRLPIRTNTPIPILPTATPTPATPTMPQSQPQTSGIIPPHRTATLILPSVRPTRSPIGTNTPPLIHTPIGVTPLVHATFAERLTTLICYPRQSPPRKTPLSAAGMPWIRSDHRPPIQDGHKKTP